jgi:hypothetical protein
VRSFLEGLFHAERGRLRRRRLRRGDWDDRDGKHENETREE